MTDLHSISHMGPLVFSSCNLDDGFAVDIDAADSVENGFGEVSSDADTHDEPRVRNKSVRTGVLDEKTAATQAGLFALHTKRCYAPYFEEYMRILGRHSGYFYADFRLQAITALKNAEKVPQQFKFPVIIANLAEPLHLSEAPDVEVLFVETFPSLKRFRGR